MAAASTARRSRRSPTRRAAPPIEFDTRGENDPEVLTNDYTYTVSASVTEDGGKYFDGEGEVRVTRGDFGMSMDVQNPILQPGDTAEILIETTDPTDPSKPVGDREVTVESGREVYADETSVFIAARDVHRHDRRGGQGDVEGAR